jgi:hypothetical protein
MPLRSSRVAYLAVTYKALLGYPKARALKYTTTNAIAKFIYKDIIYR